jgi:hypothetical protein
MAACWHLTLIWLQDLSHEAGLKDFKKILESSPVPVAEPTERACGAAVASDLFGAQEH